MENQSSLSDDTLAKAKGYARSMAPWNRDLPWYWVGIEGAIALGIGLYFVFAPDAANSTVRILLAAVLVVASAFDIITGFRNSGLLAANYPMTPFLLVRGGAGVALGITFFLASRSEMLSTDDARVVLAYGLLAYGIIGIVGNIWSMIRGNMLWFSIASNIVFFLLGAVLLYNDRESVASDSGVRYIGYALIVGGAIMLVYTYFLKSGQESEEAAITTPTVMKAAQPPTPSSSPSSPVMPTAAKTEEAAINSANETRDADNSHD